MRLTDRMGKRLLWGGDLEMTFALHHAGWELEVDSELRMLHYLEAHRLSWQYFRRMQRWSGVSAVMLSACTDSIAGRKRAWSLNTCWQRYALGVVKRLILSPHSVWLWLFSTREDSRVLEVEREIGKLTGLLTMRAEFNRPYGSRVRSFEPDVQRRRDYLR